MPLAAVFKPLPFPLESALSQWYPLIVILNIDQTTTSSSCRQRTGRHTPDLSLVWCRCMYMCGCVSATVYKIGSRGSEALCRSFYFPDRTDRGAQSLKILAITFTPSPHLGHSEETQCVALSCVFSKQLGLNPALQREEKTEREWN